MSRTVPPTQLLRFHWGITWFLLLFGFATFGILWVPFDYCFRAGVLAGVGEPGGMRQLVQAHRITRSFLIGVGTFLVGIGAFGMATLPNKYGIHVNGYELASGAFWSGLLMLSLAGLSRWIGQRALSFAKEK